jgi:hypothetical protein
MVQTGIKTESVSRYRKETWQKEINRTTKTSEMQISNKVYVCILFK